MTSWHNRTRTQEQNTCTQKAFYGQQSRIKLINKPHLSTKHSKNVKSNYPNIPTPIKQTTNPANTLKQKKPKKTPQRNHKQLS